MLDPGVERAYFLVARRPDLLNTEPLDGNAVAGTLQIFSLDSSLPVTSLDPEDTGVGPAPADSFAFDSSSPNTLTVVQSKQNLTCKKMLMCFIAAGTPLSVELKDSPTDATVSITATAVSGAFVPVHSQANQVMFRVWDLKHLQLSVSDDVLEKVQAVCGADEPDLFQSARLSVLANFSADTRSFVANVLTQAAVKVSVDSASCH